jgi:hypothetical protein
VPQELVDKALALAQHAPSNSNIQPWRLDVCQRRRPGSLEGRPIQCGRPRGAAHPGAAKEFEHYRYELGAEVYGSMGITVADTARRAAAVMRNFDFFGAPLAGIVGMHRNLGPADTVS